MSNMCGDIEQVSNGHIVSTPYVVPADDGGDFLEAQDRGCLRDIWNSLSDNGDTGDSGVVEDSSIRHITGDLSWYTANNDQFFLHLNHRGVLRHIRHLISDAFAVTRHNKGVAKNGKRTCKHPQFFKHLRIQ